MKVLKPIDTNLPDNHVKGAVVVDSQLAECYNDAVMTANTLPSTFILIDRKNDKLPELIKRISAELRLPEEHTYGLIRESPKQFITQENLENVEHGFMLTISASPEHYVKRIREILTERDDLKIMEWAVAKLDEFSMDSSLIKSFYQCSSIELLFSLVKDDRVAMRNTLLSTTLRALSGILDLRVDSVGWEAMPKDVVASVASLVTGRAKREETSTLLVALQMIDKLVNSNDQTRDWVLEEVPIETLIRHVERSDERISFAALCLMNSMLKRCNSDEKRMEMINALTGVPFRNAVKCSFLRGGREREESVLEQLVFIQKVLISAYDTSTPSDADIQKIIEHEVLVETSTEEQDDWKRQLKEHVCGKLATNAILRFIENQPQDLRTLISENTMRTEGGKWQLIPLLLRSADITAELFGIVKGQDAIPELIVILFSSENVYDAVFVCTVQLFHRTWREMQAKEGEMYKVTNVVFEQIRHTLKKSIGDIERLSSELEAMSYWEMQEIWRKEQAEKENDQLLSKNIRLLGEKLRPRMEEIVKVNFRNHMKKGYNFKRHGKGKNLSKATYWFWKLDNSEKLLTITPNESENYVDEFHDEAKRQIWLKEIENVTTSDEIDRKASASRFGSSAGPTIRKIQLNLRDGEVIVALTPDERTASIWMEGLSQIIGINQCRFFFSVMEAMIDRMLKMELRVRLLDVDVPSESCHVEIPPIPEHISKIITNH
ncbi:unnamed protein product [Caenorhabditis bovis]|uniref:ELMO domain-containing protein n=1 Tax=Caenorhabditis bovis TaxID=2654633 RepID=A0A8S1F9M6_9PELO|nr:unnamed protein product [Caenorhabditis bovis]